jgi:two-component system sensor histidine kinase YesM
MMVTILVEYIDPEKRAMPMFGTGIRTKLIGLLLLATVVPAVISMAVTYGYTKESIKQRSVQENANLLFQAKTNIVNYMDSLSKTTFRLYNAPSLQLSSNRLLQILQTGADDYQSRAELYATLQSMSHAAKEIYQVRLYTEANGMTTLIVQDAAKRSYQGVNEIKFPPGTSVFVETTHQSSYYGMQNQFPYYPPASVISMHRQVYDVPSTRVLGSISLDVQLDVIRQICDQLVAKGQEQLYLIDDKGKAVYSTDPDAAGGGSIDLGLGQALGEQGSFDRQKATNIYQRIDTPYMNWTIVKRIPDSFLYASARELTGIQLAIAASSLCIIIIATLFISVHITSPIKSLIGYISRIQAGRLDVRIDVESNDEIGILAKRFQSMMETINDLIFREYKLELANKTNELKALQAQINPHFLNNALQSIGTLALQHDAPRVYSLISSLAKMMRYSMTTGETSVPLVKELEHVKAYLALQRQRFGDQVEVEYKLDETTYEVPVPKMVLQPLAENYFKHGFEPGVDEPGRLSIETELTGAGYLRITVEDNGKGMSDETLLLLQNELAREPAGDTESIGLRNVQQRLRLYYDVRAELQLARSGCGGLRVTLLIPQTENSMDGPTDGQADGQASGPVDGRSDGKVDGET